MIVGRSLEADAVATEIATGRRVLRLPESQHIPYDTFSPTPSVTSTRLLALARLASGQYDTLVASAHQLLERLPPLSFIKETTLELKVGMTLPSPGVFAEQLVQSGYVRTSRVEFPSQVAVRGAVVDIFPPTQAHALRVRYDDDVVELLSWFDPHTQRTLRTAQSVQLGPCQLWRGNAIDLAAARARYCDRFNVTEPVSNLASQIFAGNHEDGCERLAPVFHPRMATLFDIAGKHFRHIRLTDDTKAQAHAFFERAVRAEKSLREARVLDVLRAEEILLSPEHAFEQIESRAETFRIATHASAIALDDRSGASSSQRSHVSANHQNKSQRSLMRIDDIDFLKEGDYIIHVHQGIGRFIGLERHNFGSGEVEYGKLEYAAGDVLYVPQRDLCLVHVIRHSDTDVPPKLDRLGKKASGRKRVKRAIENAEECAEGLIQLHALRAMETASPLPADKAELTGFLDAFPWDDTPDQLAVTWQIASDLSGNVPMDRLLCGDVGFGKTEVAARAIFVAAKSGAQSCVLAPTAILVRQHMQTLSNRLQPFGISVALLPPAQSAARRRIEEQAQRGEIDVLISTHAVASADNLFAKLGLIVIDEEHKFGVAHKEKLRAMHATAHMLSLSATPIPRTLEMAMSGIRSFSTLQTPIAGRLPVQTVVCDFDAHIVRDAIEREIARGGQVYYVHNRVADLERAADNIQRLVPDARIRTIHGQGTAVTASSTMEAFHQGQIDVLVGTTVLESGLDSRRANTMIIDGAEMFGLASLHQLRGRVGRSDRQAYCFALVRRDSLDERSDALRRLRTLRKASRLGGGFDVAMGDLELRGAGDLLGTAQSGHVNAVGANLYSSLLKDAIARRSRGDGREDALHMWMTGQSIRGPARIDLGDDAYVPSDYIPDASERLSVYRRLARASSAEVVNHLGEEMLDRFGPLPHQARALLRNTRLQTASIRCCVTNIHAQPQATVVRVTPDPPATQVEALARFAAENHTSVRLQREQLRLGIGHADPEECLHLLSQMFETLGCPLSVQEHTAAA